MYCLEFIAIFKEQIRTMPTNRIGKYTTMYETTAFK